MRRILILSLLLQLVMLSACDKADGVSAKNEADLVINRLFPESSDYVKYDSARKYKNGKIRIKGFEWAPKGSDKWLEFDELVIESFDYTHKDPHFYKISLKGLLATDYVKKHGILSSFIIQADLEDLVKKTVIDLSFEQDWLPDGNNYTASATISMRDLAELDISYSLTGISEAVKNAGKPSDLNMAIAGLQGSKLKQVSVVIRNKKLIQSLVKQVTPELLRSAREKLETKVEKSGRLYQNQLFAELSKFLFGNKRMMRISIRPNEPVDLVSLSNEFVSLYNSDTESKQNFFDTMNIEILSQ